MSFSFSKIKEKGTKYNLDNLFLGESNDDDWYEKSDRKEEIADTSPKKN